MKKQELEQKLREVELYAEDVTRRWEKCLDIGAKLLAVLEEVESQFPETVKAARAKHGLVND